ncbi:MAG: CPBP family intramembrane metalloprotease [Oscillospiraceae bacterium]|jgi:hypothetical protein|nr:CPBP family intramembrane metalloprotease [Oscillospiraceae bacterium]
MKQSAGGRAVQVLIALGKSVCYLALFLGAQLLVMLPVVVAAAVQSALENWEAAEQLSGVLYESAMLFTAVSGLLAIGVILLFYRIRRKKLGDALWLRRVEGPGLLSGAALAPALYLAVTVAMMALPEAWLDSYAEASSGVSGGGVIGIVAVVLVAPVVEEFIFRGLIMTRLAQAMPGWLAAALSAAIFGLCHGHPVWFAYTFVLGVLFGLMDLRLGSIWPSILAHMVFNGVGQILDLLPEDDVVIMGAYLVLVAAAVVLPVLARREVKALFRPKPQALPAQEGEPPAQPGGCEWNPWDE